MRRYITRDPRERFEENYVRGEPDECWLWTGFEYGKGYGGFFVSKKVRPSVTYAHRYSFQLYVRPLKSGESVHHKCGVKRCVNPHHLEALLQWDHMRIHDVHVLSNKARTEATHCRRGHKWTAENTGSQRNGKGRYCRACHRERTAAWRANNS